MKNRTVLILSCLLLCSPLLEAQDQAKIPSSISTSLKAGNASELAKHFNSTVELLLLDKEDFYKKDTVEAILKDFFSTYQTQDFVIRHQGARNDAKYAIGTLKTSKGDFRVYFLMKKSGDDIKIHQIRIEPENER